MVIYYCPKNSIVTYFKIDAYDACWNAMQSRTSEGNLP